MFTVLIADKEHIDAIQQKNRLFFEPFLENKELAFCYWNQVGQSLSDSVPGLTDAVGRKKLWRAVILSNGSDQNTKMRNPFDAVDPSAISDLTAPSIQPEASADIGAWEASWREYHDALTAEKEAAYRKALEFPLQKLTTWLCFRPEDYILSEVQEKQDIHDWALEMIAREGVKPSEKLEMMERDQYKRELRLKECLRREFVGENYPSIAYPTEVYCISTRSADNNYFDPDEYWTIRQDSEYSTFADRNMYFDRMRFMVYDVLPTTHRNYRSDYIRFLASVLIFISNPIPGSAMQSRHLYRLEVETDDSPLTTLVTSYDKKLSATSEVIDNEMEKIRSEIPGELSDKAAEEMFCSPNDISVILDESCEPDKVIADKDYGLFFDSPENEYHKWNRDYASSKKALEYIVRQQSRSVRKGVNRLRLTSEISNVNVSRLTPLQIDDIRDYTNASEDEMIKSIPPDLSDMTAYTSRISEENDKVKKTLRRRMTKKTSILLSLISLFLYLVCFFPFLFANNGTTKTVTTAVLLVGIMLGALAAVMFVTLIFLKKSVLNAVREYNNTARGVLGDINASLNRVSRYLSASCNVQRGHAVQRYAERNLDEYTKSLRIRKKHQEDIRRRRAYLLEEYGDFFGDRSFCDETMSRPYDYDFDQKTEYAYPAPFLAGDCRQIEFMSNGNFVTVPSSYVTSILVKMEGIYEK